MRRTSLLLIQSLSLFLVMFLCFCFPSSPVSAGPLDPSGGPDSSSTRMYSLDQIYDLASSGKNPSLASSFASPSSGPGSTMRTLNEVCDILKSKFSACTAGAGDVLAGKYFFATELTTGGTGAWGATRGTITDRGNGGAITPGTTDQTIASGFWRTGHTVLGDADLLPVNIRSGVTIFGAAGTLSPPTGDAAITDVLAGKTFSNTGATGLTGTIPTQTLSASSTTVGAGYYAATDLATVDPDLAVGNIKSGTTVFGLLGTAPVPTGDAAAGDVLTGKTFSNTSATGISGTMANNGAITYTPGTSNQAVAAGYHNGSGYVEGDTDLVSTNIRSTASIFGVAGDSNVVNTSSGDAINTDILSGKKAWVDGAEVTGSSAAGSNVTGADGDISFTIPDGLYSGSKTATAQDSNLLAGNIADGVEIFGVTGDLSGGGILKTGQTTPYQTDYPGAGNTDGCDGAYQAGTAISYSWGDLSHDTVIDNVTGLMWASDGNGLGCYSGGSQNWTLAIAWAEDLDFAGYDDWRLPNRRELESLINCENANPSIDTTYFPNTRNSAYWTSTTVSADTAGAWAPNFSMGYTFYEYKSTGCRCRAVRGGL